MIFQNFEQIKSKYKVKSLLKFEQVKIMQTISGLKCNSIEQIIDFIIFKFFAL